MIARGHRPLAATGQRRVVGHVVGHGTGYRQDGAVGGGRPRFGAVSASGGERLFAQVAGHVGGEGRQPDPGPPAVDGADIDGADIDGDVEHGVSVEDRVGVLRSALGGLTHL